MKYIAVCECGRTTEPYVERKTAEWVINSLHKVVHLSAEVMEVREVSE